jgi:hypothetical protein
VLRAGSAQDELRTGDAVGNRLSLTTTESVVNYQYDDANLLVLSEVEGLTQVVTEIAPYGHALKTCSRCGIMGNVGMRLYNHE